MKRFFGFLLMLLTVVAVSAKDIKTVILTTNPELECGKCENKVKENLRFVKGVKKIEISVPQQTVTIIYDPRKSTYQDFEKAFEKIGFRIEAVGKKK